MRKTEKQKNGAWENGREVECFPRQSGPWKIPNESSVAQPHGGEMFVARDEVPGKKRPTNPPHPMNVSEISCFCEAEHDKVNQNAIHLRKNLRQGFGFRRKLRWTKKGVRRKEKEYNAGGLNPFCLLMSVFI